MHSLIAVSSGLWLPPTISLPSVSRPASSGSIDITLTLRSNGALTWASSNGTPASGTLEPMWYRSFNGIRNYGVNYECNISGPAIGGGLSSPTGTWLSMDAIDRFWTSRAGGFSPGTFQNNFTLQIRSLATGSVCTTSTITFTHIST